MRYATVMLLLSCFACAEVGGREHVRLRLSASGTAPRTVTLGSAQLLLTRADVAFGPAWFCSSEGARAELCEVALAELRSTVLVRALDPAQAELGELVATTGEVRSAMFDYGYSWLLTAEVPRPSPVAPAGHSAVLEGTLRQGERTLRFAVALDVKPRLRGEAALNGQRTRYTISEASERLNVGFDPHAWVERLEPEALFALDSDGDGAIVIEPGTSAYESVLQGMTSRAPATFAWSPP